MAHHDSSFEVSAQATMLQTLALPATGGQTRSGDTRKAYEELTDGTKARIDDW